VRAFSLAVPAQVICLLGVPSADVDQFSTWSNVMFGDCSRPPERIDEAQGAIGGYMAIPADDGRKRDRRCGIEAQQLRAGMFLIIPNAQC
jgi:cytochrome P450